MVARKPLVLSSGAVAEMAAGDTLDRGTMLAALSWAGQFPFAAGASDATISADTDLTDTARYKQYRTLTINAGIKLKCRRTPFFLFADTLSFGSTSSEINCDGPSAVAVTLPTYGDNFARGGYDSASGCGGCGGGLLIVCARVITGAAGVIAARGGNGYVSGSSAASGRGGQGALSKAYNGQGSPEDFTASLIGRAPYWLLRNGGDYGSAAKHGLAGGSGGGSTTLSQAGGGSGLGGGGAGSAAADSSIAYYPTPAQLLDLAAAGCLGGGGGGVVPRGIVTEAAGGGGGGVVVFAQQWDVTPTLAVTGGLSHSGAASGAAGFGFLVKV